MSANAINRQPESFHNKNKDTTNVAILSISLPIPGPSLALCQQPGMHLTEIDHHTIVHMNIEEVRQRIAGKRGSRVVLKLTDRDGGANAYLGGRYSWTGQLCCLWMMQSRLFVRIFSDLFF